jgi:hypothetical protein
MPKVEEWRTKVEEWKAILNQPGNLGLKAGGTGISEALRKVGDAEMDFEKAKDPAKGQVVSALTDLLKALDDLVALCKKTIDKNKAFTTACRHLEGVREAAVHRRTEAAHEVDEMRKAVGARCGSALQHLKGAHTMQEFGAAWHAFVADFEARGKGFPTLRAHIAKVKEQAAPDHHGTLDQVRPAYLKLVQNCQNATAVR